MLLTYKKKSIGHYARVLVDIDLPKLIFDEAMVERDVTLYMLRLYISEAANFFFFCNCFNIGHSISQCNKFRPKPTRGWLG
jgi:hypothetical protein